MAKSGAADTHCGLKVGPKSSHCGFNHCVVLSKRTGTAVPVQRLGSLVWVQMVVLGLQKLIAKTECCVHVAGL
jgi:hypothetical protein